MSKILLVIAPQNFRDSEYFIPKEILESHSISTSTASKIAGEITGVDGKTTEASHKVQDIDPVNYDGIAFIGGPGMAEMISDPEFINLAKKFYDKQKIVSAICAGAAILANAGILKDKKATGWAGISDVLKSGGAIYEGKSIEIDGKIVTADGPQSAQIFGQKLVELINSKA